MRKLSKYAVGLAGYSPLSYSGHSMRAGGATDLFNAGVAYPVIKKFGSQMLYWCPTVALALQA